MMTAAEVIRVLDALGLARIRVWLDGGWGVDALLGEQTRDHDDLDLVIPLESADQAIATLSALGYVIELDHRPTRLVLAARDRKIDFHPVVFDGDGDAVQKGAGYGGGDAPYPADGFAGQGSIADRRIACLTPRLLVMHHLGYTPTAKDRHNVGLLCERFGIPLPNSYR